MGKRMGGFGGETAKGADCACCFPISDLRRTGSAASASTLVIVSGATPSNDPA